MISSISGARAIRCAIVTTAVFIVEMPDLQALLAGLLDGTGVRGDFLDGAGICRDLLDRARISCNLLCGGAGGLADHCF